MASDSHGVEVSVVRSLDSARTVIRNRGLPVIALAGIALFASGCEDSGLVPTEDPEASVVRLRNDLIEFAKGGLGGLTGLTHERESFILIDGYPTRWVEELAIPEPVKAKLKAINPPLTERYVLARANGSEFSITHSGSAAGSITIGYSSRQPSSFKETHSE